MNNDLISRSALKEWLTRPTGFRANCEDCTEINCLDCIIDEAIDNAPAVDAGPKWISVEDRLPEGVDEVLVLFENGDMMNAKYDCCIDDESRLGTYRGYYHPYTLGFLDGEWVPYEGVTHWMPLPEPPKEG